MDVETMTYVRGTDITPGMSIVVFRSLYDTSKSQFYFPSEKEASKFVNDGYSYPITHYFIVSAMATYSGAGNRYKQLNVVLVDSLSTCIERYHFFSDEWLVVI